MKTVLVLSMLVVISHLVGCKDECADRIDQKLDPFAVEAVPYESGQPILFTSSDGDDIELNTVRIEEILKPDAPYACEGYLEVRLVNTQGGDLFMELLMRGSGQSNLIQIIIFHERIGGPIIQFLVEEDHELIETSNDAESTFFDHLTIDGVEYHNVLKLTHPNLLEPNRIKEFYYNASFGILKIVTNDNFSIGRI